tara:strand:+ start:5218 stop:6591 length:1374 start_codon:yes stop_codon:yes gene_type:complete
MGFAERVIYRGVDALTLWFPSVSPISSAWLKKLDILKSAKQAKDRILRIGEADFEVLPHGTSSGFAYVLNSNSYQLMITKKGAFQATLRAAFLHLVGLVNAVKEVVFSVNQTRVLDVQERPKVSRLDIHADLIGCDVPCLDMMLTRARHRVSWGVARSSNGAFVSSEQVRNLKKAVSSVSAGSSASAALKTVLEALGYDKILVTNNQTFAEHRVDADYFRGNKRTGITLGKGEVSARVYSKTEELKGAPKKRYIENLWQANGWSGESVVRVEFQCRSGFLESFDQVLNSSRDVGHVLSFVPAIWEYLTGKWCRHLQTGKSKQRTRWPVSSFWRAVQGAFGNVSQGLTRYLVSPAALFSGSGGKNQKVLSAAVVKSMEFRRSWADESANLKARQLIDQVKGCLISLAGVKNEHVFHALDLVESEVEELSSIDIQGRMRLARARNSMSWVCKSVVLSPE